MYPLAPRLQLTSYRKVVRSLRYFSKFRFLEVGTINNGYSVLQMQKAPVNSMSLEMNIELIKAIKELEQHGNCRGVIITSKLPVFCAGLDINEMCKPDINRLKDFWTSCQQLAFTLLSTPLVLGSAINGSCLAGGCIIAFLSNYCVMSDNENHRIGLSATKLGIVPPFWLLRLLSNLVGHRKAELYASQSILLHPQEAYRVGMVSCLAPPDKVLCYSISKMEKWLSIADVGRCHTKMLFNSKLIADMQKEADKEINVFSEYICQAEVQNLIARYLSFLAEK